MAARVRDLVPQPGIEPGPLHWERIVLPTGPPGKFQHRSSKNNMSAVKPWHHYHSQEIQHNTILFSDRVQKPILYHTPDLVAIPL